MLARGSKSSRGEGGGEEGREEQDNVYMCVCVCVCVYRCIHTHTHTHRTSAATMEEAMLSVEGGAAAKQASVFLRHRPVCTAYSVCVRARARVCLCLSVFLRHVLLMCC